MNRKQFLSVFGAIAATTLVSKEKMVLYDDAYGKSLVPESLANGTFKPRERSVAEMCEEIRREAFKLAESMQRHKS